MVFIISIFKGYLFLRKGKDMEQTSSEFLFCMEHWAELLKAKRDTLSRATPRQRHIIESRHIPKAKRDAMILADKRLIFLVRQLNTYDAMIKTTQNRMFGLCINNAPHLSSEIADFIRQEMMANENDADALTRNAHNLLATCM